jgi:FlaA1/EpsC-like NDP-sugar epimerase
MSTTLPSKSVEDMSVPRFGGEPRAWLHAPTLVAIVLALLDAVAVIVGYSAALPLRFAGHPPEPLAYYLSSLLPLIVFVHVASNYAFGMYHRAWRYVGASDLLSGIASAAISGLIVLCINLLGPGMSFLPRSSVILGAMFSLIGFIALRCWRLLLTSAPRLRSLLASTDARGDVRDLRVLIFGAGEAGGMLAGMLDAMRGGGYRVVGFIDDDPRKIGTRMRGHRIHGSRQSIPGIADRFGVDVIVVASYSIGPDDFREVVEICEETDAIIKVLPDLYEFLHADKGSAPIRDVTVEDLLGRETAKIDEVACGRLISGKTVMITGAAGSIGSELTRQIFSLQPAQLILVDNNETGLHNVEIARTVEGFTEGAASPDEPPVVRAIVADVADRARMTAVFERFRPEILFHAAAYKHVPMMEKNPEEAVRVNIMGTRVTAELAVDYGLEHYVLVSTDKAVKPTSVMGATKRLCELLVTAVSQVRNGREAPLFTTVRFGNVLGSRGSVVPTFQRQIEVGGPVTVTHPGMTRYFMSISEAVSLIIEAAAMTEGDDLFMLDMGDPIRIDDLARRLIRFRGLRPGNDIPVVYTGTRPGEKLHEELAGDGEALRPTSHAKILRLLAPAPAPEAILARIDTLYSLALCGREDECVALLMKTAATTSTAVETSRSQLDRSA